MTITANTQQIIGRVRRIWSELDHAQRRSFELATGVEMSAPSRPDSSPSSDPNAR